MTNMHLGHDGEQIYSVTCVFVSKGKCETFACEHMCIEEEKTRPMPQVCVRWRAWHAGEQMYSVTCVFVSTGQCETFGCEHMCIEDAKTGPKCVCGEGYDMMDDMMSCVCK